MGRYLVLKFSKFLITLLSVLFILSLLEWSLPGSYQDDEWKVTEGLLSSPGSEWFKIFNSYLYAIFIKAESQSLVFMGRTVPEVLKLAAYNSLVILFLFLILTTFLITGALWVTSSTSERLVIRAHRLADIILSIPYLILVPVIVLLISDLRPSSSNVSFKILVISFLLSIRFFAVSLQVFLNSKRRLSVEPFSKTWFVIGGGKKGYIFRWLSPLILTPWLQMLPGSLVQLLIGNTLMETLFQYQGLGFLFVEALQSRDWPVLRPYMVWVCILFFSLQFLIDLVVGYLDPRLRDHNE